MHTTGHSNHCPDYRLWFQDYLDGTLPKQQSLELFLHMRECQECALRLKETERLFQLLDSLPSVSVPEDFNEKVLSAVPYQAYKEMAPLRRERVPVFLEEEFLPASVRAVTTRATGGLVAAAAAVGLVTSWLPDVASVVVVAGLLPEALVRLQDVARRLTLAVQRSQSQ
jgi:anti-sigma factor RsiW